MSDTLGDDTTTTEPPACNPYRAPEFIGEHTESPSDAPWWHSLWVGTVTVMKGFAYGIIGCQCIILFGTIGIRVVAGEQSAERIAGLFLTAVTVGAIIVPLYLWNAFARKGHR